MILIVCGVFLLATLGPLIPKVGHNIPWEILALIIAILVNHFAAHTKSLGDSSDIQKSFPMF